MDRGAPTGIESSSRSVVEVYAPIESNAQVFYRLFPRGCSPFEGERLKGECGLVGKADCFVPLRIYHYAPLSQPVWRTSN